MSELPVGFVLSLCPACGLGHLRVIRFKATNDPACRHLRQLGEHPLGGIRPTVVVECTERYGDRLGLLSGSSPETQEAGSVEISEHPRSEI